MNSFKAKEEVRDSTSLGDLMCKNSLMLALRMKGVHTAREAGGLWMVKAGPGWLTERKWGPQPYNHKELNYANN